MNNRAAVAGVLWSAVLLSVSAPGGAAGPGPGDLTVSTGFDYSSGKYGGSQSTEILYIPVTGRYRLDPWTFRLTVPYISVTGPDTVIPGVGTVARPVAPITTRSGLGDMIAAATYSFDMKDASLPAIDLTGKVKLATADANQGLGTGENDYTVEADAYKAFGSITGFATLGFTRLGSSATIRLNDVFYVAVGASHKFTNEVSGGLTVFMRQAASATSGDQGDLTAFVAYKFAPQWKLQTYVLEGFSSGSPDWAVGALVAKTF